MTSIRNKTLTTTTLALLATSLLASGSQASPTKRLRARAGRSHSMRLISATTTSSATSSARSTRKPKPGTSPVSSKGLTESGPGASPVSPDRLNGPSTSTSSADSSSSTGSSTASSRPNWAKNLSLTFLASIDGPVLNTFDDRRAVVNSLNDQNFLNLGYRIGNGWSASGTFDFSYSPSSQEFSLMDPFISVKKSGIVDTKGYRLNAQARVYGGASARTQAQNVLGISRFTLDQSYSVARWTVGLTTYAQTYFYNSYRAANAARLKYLAEPSLSYQVSPSFSANLTYDMEMKNRHEHGLLDFDSANTYLIPSVSWSPTNWLNLEPSLILTPGSRIATDTTAVNVTATISVL